MCIRDRICIGLALAIDHIILGKVYHGLIRQTCDEIIAFFASLVTIFAPLLHESRHYVIIMLMCLEITHLIFVNTFKKQTFIDKSNVICTEKMQERHKNNLLELLQGQNSILVTYLADKTDIPTETVDVTYEFYFHCFI